MVKKVEQGEQVGYEGYAGGQDDLRNAFSERGGHDHQLKDYASKDRSQRNLQGVSRMWQLHSLFSAAG